MGIRFLCKACDQRLHVKGFLAGKRGYCPHCGATIDIPEESQIAPRLRVKSEAATAEASASGARVQEVGDRDELNVASQVVATVTIPDRLDEASQQNHDSNKSAGSRKSAPDERADRVKTEAAKEATANGKSSVAPGHTEPEASEPSETPDAADPIAEAPDAVWYVRPTSGGQFGPAKGDVMRKWLEEGRVSADSLVWREGWPEWQLAGPVFPSLEADASSGTPSETTAPPSPAEGPGALAATDGQIDTPVSKVVKRKRRSAKNSTAIATVITLGLLSVLLLVILLYVVMP